MGTEQVRRGEYIYVHAADCGKEGKCKLKMDEHKDETHSEAGLDRLAIVSAVIIISISGLALAGWLLNWLIITRISPDYIPMAPSTATFFFISGAALLLYSYQPANITARKFARAGAAFILVICFIILVDYLAGSGFDIERILLPAPGKFDQVPVGRISPITATSFVLSGSALLLLLFSPEGKQRTKSIAAYLATSVLSVGLVILIGYLYGTPLLYGGTVIPVALTTAVAFVSLGVGILAAAGQHYWPVSAFTGSSVRARLMRMFLPVTIALILISGWLDIVIYPLTNNHILASSLVAILSVSIISIVISKIAQIIGGDLDRADTERKLAEDKLSFLASIVESSTDAIFGTTLDGTVLSWNRGAEKMYGYSSDEMKGSSIEILVPHDRRNEISQINEKKRRGELIERYETVRLRKDGKRIDVSLTISTIKDDSGRIIGYSTIARDITERKRAEQIRLDNERLAAADKAKSEFLANMSHELRTPLNASIGFSELLNEGMAGELSEKQKHFVKNILTSNQFLLTLINDILDLSKIEAGKMELSPKKMSVPETIAETLSLIKEKAMKHNVLLKMEFDPELVFIEADKQRFKQILFNLLSNAVKFSKEEGGTLTITAKKEGDIAKISVSDTGIGIKEENIRKLFHKFEQIELGISQKYGGTGLGLAITKQLVELHGGKIQAESKYGEGSTFTFTLPLKATLKEK
ncbi:MAG: ATP-binding protein [Candidatus Methanoperedens sp.]|nr:ATP-binding protein [Candidatus Methanoperedens sp.]